MLAVLSSCLTSSGEKEHDGKAWIEIYLFELYFWHISFKCVKVIQQSALVQGFPFIYLWWHTTIST